MVEDYNPMPPKQTLAINVRYEYRGRGTPLAWLDPDEPRRLVESWRTYRRMLIDEVEPRHIYTRLCLFYRSIIRRRLGHYDD